VNLLVVEPVSTRFVVGPPKPCFVFAVARINQFKLAVISQSSSDNIAKGGETHGDL